MMRTRSPDPTAPPSAMVFVTRRRASSRKASASSHRSFLYSQKMRGENHSSPMVTRLSRSLNPRQWSSSGWVSAKTARYGFRLLLGRSSTRRSTMGVCGSLLSFAQARWCRSSCMTVEASTTIVVLSPVPTGQKTKPCLGSWKAIATPFGSQKWGAAARDGTRRSLSTLIANRISHLRNSDERQTRTKAIWFFTLRLLLPPRIPLWRPGT